MIACWCQDKSFKIKHEFHDSPHPIESENLSACYRLLLTLKMELNRERAECQVVWNMIRVCYKAENCVDFLLLMTHCPGECVISVTSPSRNGHKQTEIFTLCQNLNGNKHLKKKCWEYSKICWERWQAIIQHLSDMVQRVSLWLLQSLWGRNTKTEILGWNNFNWF